MIQNNFSDFKKVLNTQKLKVSQFAALHSELVTIFKSLEGDENMVMYVSNYFTRVSALESCKILSSESETDAQKAQKKLVALVNEIKNLNGRARYGMKSNDLTILKTSEKVYNLYRTSANGERLMRTNVEDIVPPFIRDMKLISNQELTSAGYSASLKLIEQLYTDYAAQRELANTEIASNKKNASALKSIRNNVSTAFQMLMMHLKSFVYISSDSTASEVLDKVCNVVNTYRATNQQNTTKQEGDNSTKDDESATGNKPAETQKEDPKEGETTPVVIGGNLVLQITTNDSKLLNNEKEIGADGGEKPDGQKLNNEGDKSIE